MIFYYFVLVHGRLITRLKTIYTTRNNLVTDKNGFGRASSILVHLSSMLCKSASWNIPVNVLKTTGAFNSESFIANESFKIVCTNTVSDYCQSYWANFIGCTHRQNNPVPSRPVPSSAKHQRENTTFWRQRKHKIAIQSALLSVQLKAYFTNINPKIQRWRDDRKIVTTLQMSIFKWRFPRYAVAIAKAP